MALVSGNGESALREAGFPVWKLIRELSWARPTSTWKPPMIRSKMTGVVDRLRATLRGGPAEDVSASTIPDLANLGKVGRLRHIQSIYERNDLRNPDILVGELLTPEERESCWRINERQLASMRRDSFYYFVVARTKFLDQVVLDAVASGIRRVLVLGAGTDTRLYRFGGHLASFDVDVAECDQPAAAAVKGQVAKTFKYSDRVQYLSADLNEAASCGRMWDWIDAGGTRPTLVFAEGVSGYIHVPAFERFLKDMASHLAKGSLFVYDFKRSGTDAGMNQAGKPIFRMPVDAAWLLEKHTSAGFARSVLTTTPAMMRDHLPSWNESISPAYDQDAFVHAWR